MNRKKIVTSMLSLSLISAMLLSACGTNNTNTGSNVSPGKTEASEGNGTKEGASTPGEIDVSKLEPREISIYFEGPDAQPDTALVEQELNKITQAKINATVKINYLGWNDFTPKMNLMMASGEPFDIMFTAGWDNYVGNVAKGAFVQLDDPNNNLLEKFGREILSNADPRLLEGSKVQNKIYAIPTQKEFASQQGILLQKELVEKYNIDLNGIKKLEDLEPYLIQVKKDYPDMIPINASSNWAGLLNYAPVGSNQSPGRLPKDGSTKIVNIYEQEDTKALLNLSQRWYKLGLFQKDPATNTDLGAQSKAGLVFAQWAGLKPGGDVEASIGIAKPWVQVALTDSYMSTDELTNSMLAISRTSKDPERAMMFLNLLHTDPAVVNLIDFGIEGKHYVKVPGKETVIKFPDGVDQSKIGYKPSNSWQVGNQYLSYTFEQEDANKWEKYKEFNNGAKTSPILGFSYNSEPVKNEEAAIAAIWKKYIDALFSGSVDVDKYLDKMNTEMKKAGMEKILEEKQRQIDAFLANKK